MRPNSALSTPPRPRPGRNASTTRRGLTRAQRRDEPFHAPHRHPAANE
jgi:hypothetical protein